MESEKSGWWHRHGWTTAILLTAFGVAFALRTIWAGPIVELWGPLYTYGGGSDSFYHSRVMSYIIANHTNLIHDPLLRYPIGATNPREPLFDWMNAILGIVFAPFFGGNANVAGAWFLDLQAPLWAALSVFPIYLIGREVGGRRVGLISAIISPFLVASINESVFAYANYLSFYTFIILVALYAYMRAVKAVGSRRWVVSYRSPRSIGTGLRNFLRYERSAVKWAVFAGVSFGALALAWQGYTYLVAIIAVFILVTMIIERIRRVDSFGLYVLTWIVGIVGFPLAVPYYYVQGEFTNWFDLPVLVFFGVLLLLLPFLLMRDYPWVVSIPTLVAIVAVGALALEFVSPVYFTNIVTGQGYFVKTLVYTTVAEAQSPSVDQLIISYGVITFFLAFAGVALVIWDMIRGKFQRWLTLFLVFGLLSLYLPFSASKFLLLGAPAFALLPAFAIKRLWDLGRYSEMRHSMASLAEERRSRWRAFRRSFKPRHALVILLVVGLLVPNIWYSMDAGIPSNSKAQYSTQIYNSLPSWLQASGASASGYYLGAAGSSLDTPNLYDSAGYNWLATQDANLPAPQRPAFVSWWDYGFQAIDQGQHPSVADNFQNGIDPAGQFLLSQNESIAIGVLVATLLTGEQTSANSITMPPAIDRILTSDGLSTTIINGFLVNLTTDYYQVINNPQVFLPVNPSTLTALNAMYMVISYYIADSLSLRGVAKLYNDLQSYTGWSVRYAMSDTRLFPFSGQDTGIFYAPADLTGRIIDKGGNPSTFFNVTILGSDGNYYDSGSLPPTVTAVQYYINYFTPFYSSMIYHIYIGYNGTDIGLANGIPGLEGDAANSPIEPGWMLQHFEVVYKTAYYCPPGATSSNPNCNVAMNLPAATALAAHTGGTADTSATAYFNGGESMLVYYAGQPLIGTVTLPNGRPVAGAQLTVYDAWGIPHQTTTTSADGSYSVILPPGQDTVNVTTGTFQGLSQAGSILLDSMKINVSSAQGYGYNTPNMVVPIVVQPSSIQGYVYWNTANSSYNPQVDELLAGAKVEFWGADNQTKYTATADASGSFLLSNVAPGVYNYNVLYAGSNYTEAAVTVQPSAPTNATVGLAPAIFEGTVTLPGGTPVPGSTVTAISDTGIGSATVSNASGAYLLGNLGPGNYTITASGPYSGYRSLGELAVITSPGERVNLSLVITVSESFSFPVTANGQPVTGFSVRFTPLPALSSNASAVQYYTQAQGVATVFSTGANGVVRGTLPAGNYSVYAVGYVGNRVYSGITSIHIPSSFAYTNPAALALAPAVPLSGTVASVDTENGTTTVVVAYDLAGDQVVTTTTSSGAFNFLLPAGTYSVQALQGSTSAPAPIYTTMTPVALRYGSAISMTPVVASWVHLEAGSPINTTGQLYPASFAMVNISAGSGGPTMTSFADAGGNVTMLVPSQIGSGATYCVRASAFGFNTTQQCGITPTGLAVLTHFPMALTPVPVTLTVYGVPAGVPITVNFTSASPTARTFSVTGGPVYRFTMVPGVYGVGARAAIGNTTIYLPPQLLTTEILVGTTQTTLSLLMVVQITVTGTLDLPSGVPLSSVTVHLNSALVNTSVSGTQFESGFFAVPGTYSLYATGQGNGQYYANLSLVRVGSNAKVTTPVHLSQRANVLNGTVVSPSGTVLASNATLTFRAPDRANVT
ncbi:MAG: carboxypeptidase regulatory-like domain-containing protein, partial [Thermoplasmata archaeon]